MTLMIELEEATQERLQARAANLGLALGEYARILLREASVRPDDASVAPGERRRQRMTALRKWLSSHADVPTLPDTAHRRASFHEDRF